MRWLPDSLLRPPRDWGLGDLLLLLLVVCPLLLLAVDPCVAASPAPATAPAPDYGGRDAPGLLSTAGTDAPNPAVQAGRSVLALVIVLGGVFGAVTLLKRGGYKGEGPISTALAAGLRRAASDPPPVTAADSAETDSASGPLVLLQSQALPGGGAVHLLCVHDRTLILLGATANGVSRITEWEREDESGEVPSAPAPAPHPAFQDHLARVDASPDPARGLERTPDGCLSDLLSARYARPPGGAHE